MPRRIKLLISEKSEKCDLTNEDCQFVVNKYKRLKDGVLYVGEWKHPLTPYYIAPDHDKFPVSIKTSFGGFIYNQWVENVLGRNNVLPAKTIEVYLDRCELIYGDRQANIWAFGNHTESANICNRSPTLLNIFTKKS
jgi:CRISPR system Cascade subunit CasA